MAWWLDPVDELDEPDELGELDGDWSWSLPDELELLFEPEVDPPLEPLEPLEPSLELDEPDVLDEWPA